MNRQQILKLQPQLQLLLQYLQITNIFLIVLVIILYSISIYCLLKEQMVAAISLATFAAIIFHLSQKYTLSVVKRWLFKNNKNREMLSFVDKEIEVIVKKKRSNSKKSNALKEFVVLLEKALKVINSKN